MRGRRSPGRRTRSPGFFPLRLSPVRFPVTVSGRDTRDQLRQLVPSPEGAHDVAAVAAGIQRRAVAPLGHFAWASHVSLLRVYPGRSPVRRLGDETGSGSRSAGTKPGGSQEWLTPRGEPGLLGGQGILGRPGASWAGCRGLDPVSGALPCTNLCGGAGAPRAGPGTRRTVSGRKILGKVRSHRERITHKFRGG